MQKILLSLIISTLLISACSIETKQPPVYQGKEEKVKIEGGEEYKEIAKKASANFQKIYIEGNIQSLFDLLDDKSQLKSDRIYWDLRFNKIQNELGKLLKSEYKRANAFQKSKTVEVRIEFVTKFEKDKSTEPRYELFYWEIYPTGEIKLLNYLNFIENKPQY